MKIPQQFIDILSFECPTGRKFEKILPLKEILNYSDLKIGVFEFLHYFFLRFPSVEEFNRICRLVNRGDEETTVRMEYFLHHHACFRIRNTSIFSNFSQKCY